MNDDEKLMKQALEALEMWCPMTATYLNTRDQAITALRERLAQPEQEPVAHVRVLPLRGDESTQQTRIEWKNGRPVAGPLYTTPSQRTWVGLTDDEIAEAGKLWVEGERMLPFAFADAIEAKLKEKNA